MTAFCRSGAILTQAVAVIVVFSVALAQQPTETSDRAVAAAIAPVYPPLAARGHISGSVAVEVVLKEAGSVASASIVNGHPLLRSAALWAAERWMFEPGPSGRHLRLQFVFALLPTNADPKEIASIFRPPYEVESRALLPQPVINYENYDAAAPSVPGRSGGKKQ